MNDKTKNTIKQKIQNKNQMHKHKETKRNIRNKTTPKHPNSKNKIKAEIKTPKIKSKYTKKSTQSQRT